MRSRSLLLIVLLAVLLLFACSEKKQNRLVLIVQNTPETSLVQNSLLTKRGNKAPFHNHYLHFVDGNGLGYHFLPQKESDTLVIDLQNKEVLEVYCRYGKGLSEGYMLLQANDTVLLRYSDVENEKPSYTSLCSDGYTALYSLQRELQDKSLYSDGEFMNEFRKSYTFDLMHRTDPDEELWADYIHPSEFEEQFNAGVARMSTAVDSAVALGKLPKAYEHYYRYNLDMQKVVPFKERQFLDGEFAITPEQYAFYNDSYQDYVSYRDYVNFIRAAYAKNGTEWSIPEYHVVDTSNGKKNQWWYSDQRSIFDRLAYMQQSGDKRISDVTYDIMLYACLDNITYAGIYEKVDIDTYLAKYKALTTRFLEKKEVEASSVLGLPFKILYFILQLNICIMVLFSLYRLLLKGSTSFIAGRLFLLLGLVLSVLVASQLVSSALVLPDKVEAMGRAAHIVGWSVVGVYSLAVLCLLYSMFRQLVRIIKMRNNSWRISENGYLLCILKDIATAPMSFFRMVFIGWNDFFNPTDSKSIEQLVIHEVYHVKHWHSIDNLLLALMRMFCWFNPFFKRYEAELRLVNEYAADRAVVSKVGAEAYIQALSNDSPQHCEEVENLGLATYFSGGSCTKRIEMVKRLGYKRKSDGFKLLFLLPAFALLTFLSPHLVFKFYTLPSITIGLF